jgi:hypothetical protein
MWRGFEEVDGAAARGGERETLERYVSKGDYEVI